MANRIYIDPPASEAINIWFAEYKTQVGFAPAFFPRSEMYLEGIPGVCYVEHNSKRIRINYRAGKQPNSSKNYKPTFPMPEDFFCKLTITEMLDGPNDYRINFTLSPSGNELFLDGEKEGIEHLIQAIAQVYIEANTFLTYGNITEKEDRVIIARGQNVDDDKVITFRMSQGKVYAVAARSHKSPEGVFSVRGHLRHYQNGKVIWIDEYWKGTDKHIED